MAKVKLRQIEQSISNNDISDFEEKYRISLPLQYIEFLKNNNGGIPIHNYWKRKGEEFVVAGFYSLKYGEMTLEEVFDDLVINENILPSDSIPFAFDPFGNIFLISNTKVNSGEIYRWEHDTTFECERVLSKSLNEFLLYFEEG